MLCSSFTLPNNRTLLNNSYHPPLALVSTPTPTPWPMVITLTPPPAPAPSPPDKEGNKKDKKVQTPPKAKTGTLTTISLVPLCLALQNCTSIATSMAG